MADAGRRQPAVDSRFIRSQGTRPFWLRRPSTRCQRLPTVKRKWASAYRFVGTPKYRICPPTTELQPPAYCRNGVVHAPPQFGFHLVELGLQSFANRLPQHRKPSLARLPADMREAEKVEGFRLTQTTALAVGRRMAAKLDQSRFIGVQFQVGTSAYRSFSSAQNCSASS